MQTKDLQNRLVVCIGDSLVRGDFSFNFVSLLKNRLETKGFQFVNAGVGGDLAYNVLRRLDPTINLQPNFVIILVGTNDIQAIINKGSRAYIKWRKKLPNNPTLEWYRENLEAIVSKLTEKTSAKIALMSIPVLGEDLSSVPNQQVTKYNEAVREVADKYGVSYLPVNEQQVEFLRSTQSKLGRAYSAREVIWLMVKGFLRHFLLRQSFDEISRKNGLLLTIECVHMNSRGGMMIADQIEGFLQSHSTQLDAPRLSD